MSSGRREVVLVVLAGLIGLGGAYLGSNATIATQRDENRESRNAEARTKRATVYRTFLFAGERYSFATLRLSNATEAVLTGRPSKGFL